VVIPLAGPDGQELGAFGRSIEPDREPRYLALDTVRGMDWLPGDKPRGMRWGTWARQLDQWRDAEDRAEDEFVVSVRALARRVGVLEDRLD